MANLTLKKSEFLAANYLDGRPSITWIAIDLMIVILPPLFYDQLALIGGYIAIAVNILFFIGVFYLFSTIYSLVVCIPWMTIRTFRQQKELHTPFEFDWTDEGAVWRSELGETRIPWSYFIKFKESKRLFLLYHSDMLFHIIPKRIFANDHAVADFKSMLNSRKDR